MERRCIYQSSSWITDESKFHSQIKFPYHSLIFCFNPGSNITSSVHPQMSTGQTNNIYHHPNVNETKWYASIKHLYTSWTQLDQYYQIWYYCILRLVKCKQFKENACNLSNSSNRFSCNKFLVFFQWNCKISPSAHCFEMN